MSRPLLWHHRASLSVTAEQVPVGHSACLSWKVIGVEASVASVHLSSGHKDGLSTIESALAEGAREVIFTRPGTFIFTLIATFGDGAKLTRQVSVHVTGSGGTGVHSEDNNG